MEVAHEQRRATGAIAPADASSVGDNDGTAAVVPSWPVEPVALLDLMVLRRRGGGPGRRREIWLGRRLTRTRRCHSRRVPLLLGRGVRRERVGRELLRLRQRRRRELLLLWLMVVVQLRGRRRELLLLLLVVILLRGRGVLGRRVGVAEEAVADVDVVVELVEIVVLAVVLVDVLHGGDGLVPVERRVAIGVHGD